MSFSRQPILIIEDSDDDYEATVRALTREGPVNNQVLRCEDGHEAVSYVEKVRTGPDPDYPRPGLILLDLNMPGPDGRAILKLLKSDPATSQIPVVILTTSDDDWSINECYAAGANTYVKKPVDLDGFFKALHALKEYWLEVAVLPRDDGKV